MTISHTPQPHTPAPPRSIVLICAQFGLLALLIYACARVVAPFVGILVWSAILAVMLQPLHAWLTRRIGRWSAILIGIGGVLLLAAPMGLLVTSLASTLSSLITGLQNHSLIVPPPPPRLAEVPVVGIRITEIWTQGAENTPAALAKYGPSLRGPVSSLAAFAGRLVAAELSFILSIVIAAVLLAYGKAVGDFARRLVQILTNSAQRGTHLVSLTVATIRGVAVGVVGVAAIQAVLLGVGFFAIGLPGAGFLTLVVLLLGIVQVPALLVLLPIIAYVFVTEPVLPAVIFAVWSIVAGLSDNVLKPLMLGRGLEVPMPVILIGVIGGMVSDGLLGLFVGPVLLAVAYVLLVDWLKHQQVRGEPTTDSPSP